MIPGYQATAPTGPAPAGLFLPVGAPHQNTAVWFITAAWDKPQNDVRDGFSILLGGVKKFSGDLGVAAVILKTFPGHPTDHRVPIHFDGELDNIWPANPYPASVVSNVDHSLLPQMLPLAPLRRGFSFVPAGLTAHIQYGAGSTDPCLPQGAVDG